MDGAGSALDLAMMYRYLESLSGEMQNVTLGEVSVPLAHRVLVTAGVDIARGAWAYDPNPLDSLVSAAIESDYVLARVMQPLLPSFAALIRHSALARAAPLLRPQLVAAGYEHIAAALDRIVPVDNISNLHTFGGDADHLPNTVNASYQLYPTNTELYAIHTEYFPDVAFSRFNFIVLPGRPIIPPLRDEPSSHLHDLAPTLPRHLSAQVPGGIPGLDGEEKDEDSQEDAPRKAATPATAQPRRKPRAPRVPRTIGDENADAAITKPKRITKRRRAPDGDDEDADPSFIPHNKLRYGASRKSSTPATRNAGDGSKVARGRSAHRKPLAVVSN